MHYKLIPIQNCLKSKINKMKLYNSIWTRHESLLILYIQSVSIGQVILQSYNLHYFDELLKYWDVKTNTHIENQKIKALLSLFLKTRASCFYFFGTQSMSKN